MSYTIHFEKDVLKSIAKWKKSNPLLLKKLENILKDIALHPRSGIGHPEPLVGGGDIQYSRRITANDRILYDIYDNEVIVIVIQVGGHYGDK